MSNVANSDFPCLENYLADGERFAEHIFLPTLRFVLRWSRKSDVGHWHLSDLRTRPRWRLKRT